ncbi:hypothetical protein H0H81_005290 [Sphagnurus paluster]|uniref:2',3'-cyclic-nucleotide 3'-phosphodiesterase n=1 Tax=Sphagnurus paluster TaxID=117069 RepID=A0A9P7FN92_9AGAR|nr:hypothetical protein H0H81_005290 [Sphagnurus paluster]
MGVSLWLVPSAQDAVRLKVIMRAREAKHANLLNSYPIFEPHVTLASFGATSPTPPLSEIRASISKVKGGLPVQFKSIEIGTHFFRSVYIAIHLTPALMSLHDEVHKKLNVEFNTPAFPHVSLCYITDDDNALCREREKFLKELKDGGRIRQSGEGDEGGVSLNCSESESEDWMAEFQASEVWLADCDGPVDGWKIIEKIPINT